MAAPSHPPRGIPDSALVLWTGIPTDHRGASDSCWVLVGGQRAYGKRNNKAKGNGYILYNEVISYRIAQAMELPVADGFVHRPPRGELPFFVQFDFNPGRDLPPAIDPQGFVLRNPAIAARTVAFDILVVNTDRHIGNLGWRRRTTPPDDVFIFDHSHALLGGAGHSPGARRLRQLRADLGCGGAIGNRHCLLDCLTDASHLDASIAAVEGLPDEVFASAVEEAQSCGLALPLGRLVLDTLRTRKRSIRDLVGRHRDHFRGVQQWTLGV